MYASAPLSTLLSHVLVAFTIEFDNEFERRFAQADGGARVASLVMWSNFMRFVGDGITVGELPTVAGLSKARIVDLNVKQRARLPYPPGSGAEGEMLGVDRFVWFVLTPPLGVAIGVWIAFTADITDAARVLTLVSTAIIVGLLYPLHVRHLVRRRRLWRP